MTVTVHANLNSQNWIGDVRTEDVNMVPKTSLVNSGPVEWWW